MFRHLSISAALLQVLVWGGVLPRGALAFVPPTSQSTTTPAFVAVGGARSSSSSSSAASSSSSTTALYISSWGVSGPPHRRAWAEDSIKENPETNVQSYLKEPAAVEARVNVDGKCLVSGLVRTPERTDQFLFDLLNHQDSAFEFDKIVAFVDDAPFAKKRLLSRSARYTGLLDKLEFVQASVPGALPEVSHLNGVKSWVAFVEGDAVLDTVQRVASLAKDAPSLENVALLLGNANDLDPTQCANALQSLQDIQTSKPDFAYTLVAVGKLQDTPEGKEAYQYQEFGSTDGVLPAKAVFSRDEGYRLVTELLQLECGRNRALCFAEVYNVNATEVRLVKGLREAGYARPQEIDHMIREGPKAYLQAIEEFKKENPDAARGYTTTDAWWEREEFQRSRRRSAEREQEKAVMVLDERTKEIETIAKEWAKREYFRQSMAGTISKDLTEDDYVKSVWDRALFEGDLKYRQMKGETINDEEELADFKSRQEKKQEVLLVRAKRELQEILEKEDLGGDDLNAALADDDDEDDDDDN